jgi:IS4 transposase
MDKELARACARGISSEFESAELGDDRLRQRLVKIAHMVQRAPSQSFPRLAATESELEAVYRFFGNERVGWQKILKPHIDGTLERCAGTDCVVAVHDTTEFHFKTEDCARDVGALPNGSSGFEGHFALAVAKIGSPVPLGLLGMIPLVRSPERPKRTSTEYAQLPRESKESERWRILVDEVENRVGNKVEVIHVMDSEADSFRLFAELAEQRRRFVIRACHDRWLDGKTRRISDALEAVEGQLLKEVPVARRQGKPWRAPKKQRKWSDRGAARKARTAKLHVRAVAIDVPRAKLCETDVTETRLNVVQVYEPDPPPGEPAVEWALLTTEPIDAIEEVATVVDLYCRRWKVEEFFKALKTGCSFEKRQLMSVRALLNALALLIPVAWRILMLRHLAEMHGEMKGKLVFSRRELTVLRKLSKRVKLSNDPTILEVHLAIAGLGGHLKRNGPPGWQTLWNGYLDFHTALTLLSTVSRRFSKSDQS